MVDTALPPTASDGAAAAPRSKRKSRNAGASKAAPRNPQAAVSTEPAKAAPDTPNPLADPIGPRLRDRRKDLKLSQTKLANMVGISISYLNLIEHSKRPIGGSLLNRLAEALQIDTDELTGANNARLIQDLSEAILDPALLDIQLSQDRVHEFVNIHPKWAKALVNLHRAYTGRLTQVEDLSARLSQDPWVAETGQQIVSHITTVRSIADILQDVEDLERQERQTFTQRLSETSKQLGENTKIFLDQIFKDQEHDWQSLTPEEQVDDFIIDNRNHFPELEDVAADLHARLLSKREHVSTGLSLALEERHNIRFEIQHGETKDSFLLQKGYRYLPAEKRLIVRDMLPEASQRFLMARVLAEREARDAIHAVLAQAPHPFAGDGLERGFAALAGYTASAVLFPYEAFLSTAQKERYDLDLLVQRFGGSFEQICHRLTTLRRPSAEGIPFSFLRSDMAGNSSKRFSVQGLRMPRQGAACPLWALYQAFRTPGELMVQLANFPNNSRFLFLARTVTKQSSAYRAPQQTFSIMIGCDLVYADQTVYGDGLDLTGRGVTTPVGSTCRLCPRQGCPQRAHASLL